MRGLGLGLRPNRRRHRLAALEHLLSSPAAISVWDVSDYSTMWQNIAGTTPVTGITQNVGKIDDLKGVNDYLALADDATRPNSHPDGLTYAYLDTMGFNFGGGAGPASCDLVCVYKGADNQGILWSNKGATASYVGSFLSGNGATTINSGPGGAIRVDGVAFTGTRDQLYSLLNDGEPHIFESRGMNLSTWSGVGQRKLYSAAGWECICTGFDVALLDASHADIANARIAAYTLAHKLATGFGM